MKRRISEVLDSIILSVSKAKMAKQFKIVCVDNSSTDNTFDIAKSVCARKNEITIECIKIAHASLCVSRNTYKYYQEYDYIAYVDADGVVHKTWAEELYNCIIKNNGDIHSGPVMPISTSDATNFYWEIIYDHKLEKSHYLIGANMIFSKNFLDECGGFPNVFPVRGDESCLLIKAKYLSFPVEMVFDSDIIAYNHFPEKIKTIFAEAWGDGHRSSLLRSLAQSHKEVLKRMTYRVISIMSLIIGTLYFSFNITFGSLILLMSIAIDLLNMRFKIFKIIQKRELKINQKISAIIVLIFVTKIFNFSYTFTFLTRKKLTITDLEKSSMPKVIR